MQPYRYFCIYSSPHLHVSRGQASFYWRSLSPLTPRQPPRSEAGSSRWCYRGSHSTPGSGCSSILGWSRTGRSKGHRPPRTHGRMRGPGNLEMPDVKYCCNYLVRFIPNRKRWMRHFGFHTDFSFMIGQQTLSLSLLKYWLIYTLTNLDWSAPKY